MTWWEPDSADPDTWRGVLARPAILLLAAVVTGCVALAILGWSVSQIGTAVAMTRATDCPAAVPATAARDQACLAVVPLGRATGRVGHKSLTHIWTATTSDGKSQTVDVSFIGSRKLRHEKSSGALTGLYWHGELVAFRGADGAEVRTDQFGAAAALARLPLLMFLAGLCLGAAASLVSRRRASVTWWGRRPTVATLGPGWLIRLSWTLVVLSFVVGVPLELGAPVWVSTLLLGLGVLVSVVVNRRASRGPATVRRPVTSASRGDFAAGCQAAVWTFPSDHQTPGSSRGRPAA